MGLLAQTGIDLKAKTEGLGGLSAADLAIQAKAAPALILLLNRGVPVDHNDAFSFVLSAKDRTLVERLIATVPRITEMEFLAAVWVGLSDFVNKYLDAGDKPLTMALVVAAWDGDTGLCKTLLDKGADPNAGPDDSSLRPRLIQAILAPTDSHEVRPEAEVPTPLVGALLQHHPETARLLLARGADPGRQSTFGSPYSLARKAGYDDVAILIHYDVR